MINRAIPFVNLFYYHPLLEFNEKLRVSGLNTMKQACFNTLGKDLIYDILDETRFRGKLVRGSIHFMSLVSFYAPQKHQKTKAIERGYVQRPVVWYGLRKTPFLKEFQLTVYVFIENISSIAFYGPLTSV